MARMIDGAARIRLALVLMVSGALVVLVPSVATSPDASAVVMLTAVAALVAALVGPGRHLMILVASPLGRPFAGAEDALSFLAARVTDTTHHPVRPRAPGVG